VEPVAFVLSLLSSLLFAGPSIANYIVPDRKPIRDMTFDELLEFVPTTDPKTDWHGFNTEWAGETFLKEDPRLRFRSSYAEQDIQCENFQEPWANCHPDKNARGFWFNLSYNGALIERFIVVSVDGGRALVPPPEINTTRIRRLHYVVAQIHDSLGSLDEYIEKSRLTVESAT